MFLKFIQLLMQVSEFSVFEKPSFIKHEKYVNLHVSFDPFYTYTLYILSDLTVDHKPSEVNTVSPVSKIFWKLQSY